jgi:hypothetical protein
MEARNPSAMSASDEWVCAQLDALSLKDGDARYSEAKQVAGLGWPAKKIAKLIGLDRTGHDER